MRSKAYRSCGCQFGKDRYHCGQQWHPNLQPYGISYCILCTCKSNGAVECVDLKNKCEKPTCQNPSVLPGRCCPQCPDDPEVMAATSSPPASYQQPTCHFLGKDYNSGQCWLSTDKRKLPTATRDRQCIECNCISGGVFCSPRKCPILKCKNQIQNNNTCCPVCKDESFKTEMSPCANMGNSYIKNSPWHPYFQPFGYSPCYECVCNKGEVNCRKIRCSELNCNSQSSFSSGGCCSVCDKSSVTTYEESPNSTIVPSNETSNLFQTAKPSLQMATTDKPKKSCKFDGLTKRHGQTWHPVLPPLGPMNCIDCHCQNGKVTCNPVICPTIYPCDNPKIIDGHCCKICSGIKDPQSTTTTVSTTLISTKTPPSAVIYRVYRYISFPSQYNCKVQLAIQNTQTEIFEIHSWKGNASFRKFNLKLLTLDDFQYGNLLDLTGQFKYLGITTKDKVTEMEKLENQMKIISCPCYCSHTMERLLTTLMITKKY
ncbi:Chordin-like protein 2 [Trichoplax sp. H2]|nr:Chordin-like protein 2 [Trichoplax sp. H2]|eukprot:RDD46613.1 Chordin-like protein 2 [Trichoplax sp. H2]